MSCMTDFWVTCLIAALHNFSLRDRTSSSGLGSSPFRGFTITHTHSVGLLWTSDQLVAETPT
jgi:hypothetical protein